MKKKIAENYYESYNLKLKSSNSFYKQTDFSLYDKNREKI